MSEEPPKLDEAALQSEAAAVERLRRHIAELPSKGEVVTPQLLAQFAVAQKRYLDRKIEFEKQRRSPTLPASGVRTKPTPTAPESKQPEPKVPVKAEPLPVSKPVKAEPATPAPKPEPVAKVPAAPAIPAITAKPAPAKVPVPEMPTAPSKKGLPIVWIIAGVAIALAVAAWLLVSK